MQLRQEAALLLGESWVESRSAVHIPIRAQIEQFRLSILSLLQRALDEYEFIELAPSHMPGQPPTQTQAAWPRPLDDDELAAPPLAHVKNCDSRYMRVTVSAIPSQQVRRFGGLESKSFTCTLGEITSYDACM